jgi:hypothetical protein
VFEFGSKSEDFHIFVTLILHQRGELVLRPQRSAHRLFGAISPKTTKAALVMPRCDTRAMNLNLAEVATQIVPGAHVALLVDPARWHLSSALIVWSNVTLIPPPAKCPELNPQENIWQFLRHNWLSNRIFKSYDDIADDCCDTSNKLIDQTWGIMSIVYAIGPTGSGSLGINVSSQRK